MDPRLGRSGPRRRLGAVGGDSEECVTAVLGPVLDVDIARRDRRGEVAVDDDEPVSADLEAEAAAQSVKLVAKLLVLGA